MWRFWRQFQLLCGRAPILSYNDTCRLGPTHRDPNRNHSTGLLGRANQWSSIYWRTRLFKTLHPICSLSACGTAGPGQSPHAYYNPSFSNCVCVKLGNTNKFLNAQGPKPNSDSNVQWTRDVLAGLAHAASCACRLWPRFRKRTTRTLYCAH